MELKTPEEKYRIARQQLDQPRTGAALAGRLATDMVASTMVGLGIGYGLDKLFDTKPWMMAIFFLFGTVAGFLNCYRLVNNPFEEQVDEQNQSVRKSPNESDKQTNEQNTPPA